MEIMLVQTFNQVTIMLHLLPASMSEIVIREQMNGTITEISR
jgi:hypothetical protein